MRFQNAKMMGVALALLAMACAPIAAQSAAQPAPQDDKNQKMVLSWWKEVVVAGRADQAAKYMADDFVDHDPNVMGGRTEFLAHHEHQARSTMASTPVESFAKGDYVVMVWEHPDKDPKSSMPYQVFTYDIVKVKDGKIQEHWDSARKTQ